MRPILKTRGRRKTNKLAELGGQRRVLALLAQTQIEPRNFSMILETLREAREQDEIAEEFGVSRATVARLKRLALRRLEEHGLTVSTSWVPMSVILPAPLAASLETFSESFDSCRDEALKRELIDKLQRVIVDSATALGQTKQRGA
jgi:DNA-binding GntR family transcriptional regulator